MKFTPKQFATAFVGAVLEARLPGPVLRSRASESELIARAVKVLRDSGSIGRMAQITEAIENVWQEKTGAKKYSITSALPMTDLEKKNFSEKLQPTGKDYLEYATDANLVAGVVVKENESRVLDLSFTKRVNALFKN